MHSTLGLLMHFREIQNNDQAGESTLVKLPITGSMMGGLETAEPTFRWVTMLCN